MALPEDPFMLMSYVNMKLRDENFDSLQDLCESLGCDKEELTRKLKDAGFEYLEGIKQFR